MSNKDISTRAVPDPTITNLKTIKTRIVNKHDTEAHWNASDVKDTFVPKQGEIVVYDIDSTHTSERIKIGDGTTAVGSLPFIGDVTAAGHNDFTGYNSFSKHVNLKYGPEGYIDFGNGRKFWGDYVTKTTDNTETYSLWFPSNKTGLHTFAMLDDLPVANPAEAGTATLTKLKVGDTVYNLPSGGGGNVTLAGNNTFTGSNTFTDTVTFRTSADPNQTTTINTESIKVDNGEIIGNTSATLSASQLRLYNGGAIATYNIDSIYFDGHTFNYPTKDGTLALTKDLPEANPTAEGTVTLTKLKIGDTVYNLPSGGGSGDVTAAGNNTFTGSNTFEKTITVKGSDQELILKSGENVTGVDSQVIISNDGRITFSPRYSGSSFNIELPRSNGALITTTDIFSGIRTSSFQISNANGGITDFFPSPSIAQGSGTMLQLPDKAGTLALTSDILEPHIVTPVYKYLHKVKLNKSNAYAPSHINIVIYVTSESNTPVTDSASFIKLLGNKFKIYPGGTIEYYEEAVPISYITEEGVYYYVGTTLEKQSYSYFTSFTDIVLENDKWENSVIKVNENTTATEELQSITIGGIQYSIPSSGSSGDVTAAGDNVFTGYNSFKNGIYIKPGAGSPELNTFCGINKSGLLVYTSASGLTSTKTISVPMKEGTLALTDDIPDLLAHFPIGYIYISTSSTSPADLFGGTWERIKDKFLLAAGDTYTAGETGGEATHTLSIQEMPSHNHQSRLSNGSWAYNQVYNAGGTDESQMGAAITSGLNTQAKGRFDYVESSGGSEAHNNMPPYLTVYMWERTA